MVVTVEPTLCGVSQVITVRTGVAVCYNDIILLMGLVGVPLVPPVLSDAILSLMKSVLLISFSSHYGWRQMM